MIWSLHSWTLLKKFWQWGTWPPLIFYIYIVKNRAGAVDNLHLLILPVAMGNDRICALPGCDVNTNNRKYKKKFTSHSIPTPTKFPKVFKAWKDLILYYRSDGYIKNLLEEIEAGRKHPIDCVICSRHFTVTNVSYEHWSPEHLPISNEYLWNGAPEGSGNIHILYF